MNIETKFEIGQEVCFLYANKILKRKILRINAEAFEINDSTRFCDNSKFGKIITYQFEGKFHLSEFDLFATIDDLLENLRKDEGS